MITKGRNHILLSSRPLFIIPAMLASVMCLIALWPLSPAYYGVLRCVVFVTALYISVACWSWNQIGLVWLFGIIATLFNPFAPIELDHDTWGFIDFVAGTLFFWLALAYPQGSRKKKIVLLFVSLAVVVSIVFAGSICYEYIPWLKDFVTYNPPPPPRRGPLW